MKKKYFECGIFRNKYLDNAIRIEIAKVFTIFKALITQNTSECNTDQKIFLFFIFKF